MQDLNLQNARPSQVSRKSLQADSDGNLGPNALQLRNAPSLVGYSTVNGQHPAV